MSSRAVLFFLLLTSAPALQAASWASIAAASTRADDPLLIQVLRESSLQDSIDLCSALGARKDPFVGDIIESLLQERTGYPQTGAHRADAELLLRILLAPMADTTQPADGRRARVAANQSAVDLILGRLDELEDPQLIAELVRMAPVMEPVSARITLVRVAARVVGALRASGGRLDDRYIALAMDLVSSATAVGGRDLLEPLVQISTLARDKAVVDAARQAAQALASG